MPLLVNEAGALVLVGRVMVVVMGPVVGPVPPLVTVMGTLLGLLATKAGAGWPMVVVRSGGPSGAGATGVVGVMGDAGLLAVTVSPGVAVVPLNTGCVPTVAALGVTGTWMVVVPPAAIGPGFTQVTV